ncbi:pyrimidine (deoxy)nucleoside triphosphate diphosphatase [Budviciaceae bacterium BWR-B9]|uniref:Pyrimidine (Deoxy)nucleoside triphosphate diphosphatase n=1 Tax=Limnobaculum allomyrinae TaxID=2791986 RepID=A0ABS1ISK4_9GAMM|nr:MULTISPECIES: pyrimidine (deoxy)nucleoside triphosphate diphosphatase [Limnobaculum]MBK5144746.1 pyrimidine (deoxy)nucleoside triphosphate diphosphatase [Limnobaculum allomyrinae]MBV7692409.1 pyrimidine (deoxy)nucleoside triphosphate diphosphatase [Limnobaculum sp. M2-1]
MKIVNVVAAIMQQQERILIAQRDSQSDLAGYWEFPGGKIENGETPAQALIRELEEEFNIHHIQVTDYIATSTIQQPERIIQLQAWKVVAWQGDIQLRCHTNFCWVTPDEALGYQLAPADIPLLLAYQRI